MAVIHVALQEKMGNRFTFPSDSVVSYRDDADNVIGQGMVGSVYGDVTGDYVIKASYTSVGRAEFEREYATLRDLWDALRDSSNEHVPLPEIAWGVRERTRDEAVLVMPRYRATLAERIESLMNDGKMVEAEQEAVSAALDYTRVMIALRSLGHTCTDRKVKDFFLDQNGRLVIIDWNVLNPLTPDFIAAEQQVFGQLWHQLFLQRFGTPPFNPFDDNRWLLRGHDGPHNAMPSIGLRTILASSVHPALAQRFADSEEKPSHVALYEVLSEWAGLLEDSAPDLNRLDEQLPRRLLPAEQNAIRFDLQWRKSGFRDYQAEREKALLDCGITGYDFVDQHSRQIVEHLERDIETALNYLDTLRRDPRLNMPETIGRWQTVLKGLVAARDELPKQLGSSSSAQRSMRELQLQLLPLMQILDRLPGEDSEVQLDKAHQHLDNIFDIVRQDLGKHSAAETVTEYWSQLNCEVELRKLALLYQKAKEQPLERRDLWQKAEDLLDKISYLTKPQEGRLADGAWVQELFDGYPVDLLLKALSSADNTFQIERAYYMALARMGDSYPRDSLAPVADALALLRHVPGDMPARFVVPRALDLCKGLEDAGLIDANSNTKSSIVQFLETAALKAVQAAAQSVQDAVDARRIAPIRDAIAAADDLRAVQPELKRLEHVFDRKGLEQSALTAPLDEYGMLYSLYADWLELARRYELEDAIYHQISDGPLQVFKAILNLIRHADELEWKMNDLLGDEEAIRRLVSNLQHAANQLTQHVEASLPEIQSQLEKHNEDVHQLQASVSTLRQGFAGLRGQPALIDRDQIARIARDVADEASASLKQELRTLTQRIEGDADRPKLDPDVQLSELASVRMELLGQQQAAMKRLVALEAEQERLVEAEKDLLLRMIADLKRREVRQDDERQGVLEELSFIARTGSLAAFGQVFEPWKNAVEEVVKELDDFQRAAKQLRKAHRSRPGGSGSMRDVSFNEVLEYAVMESKKAGSLAGIRYWYIFAHQKYEQARNWKVDTEPSPNQTLGRSTERSQPPLSSSY